MNSYYKRSQQVLTSLNTLHVYFGITISISTIILERNSCYNKIIGDNFFPIHKLLNFHFWWRLVNQSRRILCYQRYYAIDWLWFNHIKDMLFMSATECVGEYPWTNCIKQKAKPMLKLNPRVTKINVRSTTDERIYAEDTVVFTLTAFKSLVWILGRHGCVNASHIPPTLERNRLTT
jgi:hypothetical protein